MDLTFKCPHCAQELEAPEEVQGTTVNCPGCSQPIAVPARQLPVPARKKTIIFRNRPAHPAPRGPRRCPYCKEEIHPSAIKCKHCGTDLVPTSHSAPAPEAGNPFMAVFRSAIILAIGVLVFTASFHIITGEAVGIRIRPRTSFGFGEFIINVDAITGMPYFSAKTRFPIGCKILQREGLIETEEQFERRVEAETKRKLEEAQREAEAEIRKAMRNF
jgi:hypothetical protein